ncbi:MAG: bifunctional riboflavin kinase/FAD synthetase [Clostridium sp.]|nr:bifunctional riboflavin kinase/FAD synthetase [Clostridium sp.]
MIIVNEKITDKNFKEGTYIALGSFDGLHKGHMALINKVVDESLAAGYKSCVYTFKNHPLTVAIPEIAPKLIMDTKQKIHLLESKDVDMAVFVSFTESYMEIEAEDFIKLLLEEYNAKGFVVGFNFKFGNQNKGDVKMLKKLSEKYGFDVFVIDPELSKDNVISSTRIRNLISKGHIEQANDLLFEPFMLRGTIIDGKKLGRKIGFPTANMSYNDKYVLPKRGVYYTNIKIGEKLYKSISSVGYNPTVSDEEVISIESYILDFDQEIYGETVSLYFLKYIRDEMKFENLDDLVDQLDKDRNYARDKEMFDFMYD